MLILHEFFSGIYRRSIESTISLRKRSRTRRHLARNRSRSSSFSCAQARLGAVDRFSSFSTVLFRWCWMKLGEISPIVAEERPDKTPRFSAIDHVLDLYSDSRSDRHFNVELFQTNIEHRFLKSLLHIEIDRNLFFFLFVREFVSIDQIWQLISNRLNRTDFTLIDKARLFRRFSSIDSRRKNQWKFSGKRKFFKIQVSISVEEKFLLDIRQ